MYESLGYLTYHASGSIRKSIGRELARKGYPIKAEQFTILVYVWEEDGQSQRLLAEKIYREKTAVTRALAAAEAVGLVERRRDPADGREKRVFLTPQGKKLMGEVTQLVQEILQEAEKGIDAGVVANCKDALRRIRQNLS